LDTRERLAKIATIKGKTVRWQSVKEFSYLDTDHLSELLLAAKIVYIIKSIENFAINKAVFKLSSEYSFI